MMKMMVGDDCDDFNDNGVDGDEGDIIENGGT